MEFAFLKDIFGSDVAIFIYGFIGGVGCCELLARGAKKDLEIFNKERSDFFNQKINYVSEELAHCKSEKAEYAARYEKTKTKFITCPICGERLNWIKDENKSDNFGTTACVFLECSKCKKQITLTQAEIEDLTKHLNK